MLVKMGEEISNTNLILIMGSGTVGALAYAFPGLPSGSLR